MLPKHMRLIPSRFLGNPLVSPSLFMTDNFVTARAVGAINGTFAEPGPAVRFVVDTGGRLSIVGGKLVSSGGGGAGDPALWENVDYGRQTGQAVIGEITKALNTTITDIGWDTNKLSSSYHAIRFGSGTGLIGVLEAGGGGQNVSSFAAGVSYQSCVIDRGAGKGFWALALGGIYTNWSLIWVSSNAGAVKSFFPNIQMRGADSSDFIKVLDSLYILPILAYDRFGDQNGPLNSTDVIGPDGQAVGAQTWTDQIGTWAIVNGVAQASALSGGIAVATIPTTSVDGHVRIKLTRSGGSVGGVARYQNASNYLRFSHDGTNALCEQVVAGTPTSLRTGVAAFVLGAVICLVVVGTTGRLFYNNAAIGASFVVPASTQVAHGLYTTNVGNGMDDFEVWAYGSNGEFNALSTLV